MIKTASAGKRSRNNLSNPLLKNDIIADLICSWLVSAGVLLALRQLFRFEHPLPLIMLRTAIILTAAVLLTRRWWHTALFVSVVVCITGLILLVTKRSDGFLSYFIGLFLWWIDLFPNSSYYNTAFNVSVVLWIISFFVCISVFIFIRKLRSFGLMAAISFILISIIYSNQFRQNLGAIAFIGSGLLPLLCANSNRMLVRTSDEVSLSIRRVMAAGITVCVVISILAHLIVPFDTSSWKNPQLSETLNRILDAQQTLSRYPLTLQSSGLQPNADHLGGDIELKHNLVLRVKTAHPGMMKGKVYSIYNGKGWDRNEAPSYQFKTNSGLLTDAFDLLLPHSVEGTNPLQDAMPEANTQVTMLFGGYTLFSSGRVSEITAADSAGNLRYSINSEIFSDSRLATRFSYQYKSTIFNKKADNIANRIHAIETAKINTIQYDLKYDAVAREYLQLPDKLPDLVNRTAHQATDSYATNFARMQALENYLKTNFKYTLTPGDVPTNEDFVDYFLKSGQGYCTYYASAMAVMARVLGVPSRFVIGYGMVPSGTEHLAYTDNAHAWVECYFRGVGWIPFDPTAGSEYSRPVTNRVNPTTPPTGSNDTSNPPAAITSQTTTSTTTSTTTEKKPPTSTNQRPPQEKVNLLPWVIILAAILAVITLAVGILRVIKNKSAHSIETVLLRFPNNAARADYYYTDLLRQLSLLGLKPGTGETIRQYGLRVCGELKTKRDEKMPIDYERLLSIFETVISWRYGEIPPADAEIIDMAAVHAMLEKRLRKSMNPIRYFLVRLLFA